MARKPTVWIANEGGHPYDNAEAFGTPIALTKGKINPFRPDRLAFVLASKLKHADENDCLLLSGPPMVNALALALWLAKFSRCNTLQWSHKYDRYELRTVHSKKLGELMR